MALYLYNKYTKYLNNYPKQPPPWRRRRRETDSEIIAALDLALRPKYHATKILKTETDNKCRLCKQFNVTV
jgi:hypothetical protein